MAVNIEEVVNYGLGITDSGIYPIGEGYFSRVYVVAGPGVPRVFPGRDRVVVKVTSDPIDAVAAWQLSKTDPRKYTDHLPEILRVYAYEREWVYIIVVEVIPYDTRRVLGAVDEEVLDSFLKDVRRFAAFDVRDVSELGATVQGREDRDYVKPLFQIAEVSRRWERGAISSTEALKDLRSAWNALVKYVDEWDWENEFPKVRTALRGIVEGTLDLFRYANTIWTDTHTDNIRFRRSDDPASVCIIDFGFSSIPRGVFEEVGQRIEALRVRAANVARHIPKLRVWRR